MTESLKQLVQAAMINVFFVVEGSGTLIFYLAESTVHSLVYGQEEETGTKT